MSHVMHRSATTERTTFMADGTIHFVAWGNEIGLELSIKPAGAVHREKMAARFVGDTLDRTIIEIEAYDAGVREMGSGHRTNTGHVRGT